MERKNEWFCEWLRKVTEIEDELGVEHGDIGLICVLDDVSPEEAKVRFQRELKRRSRKKCDWSRFGF